MTRTFIKDEERYAEWYALCKHVYEKSPRSHLNWSLYRNSGLENKHNKAVVIINTGPRQEVITATLEELKTYKDLPALAKQRTKNALNALMFIRQPANDDSRETKRPLSRRKVTARPARKRKRQLVPG